MSDEGKNVFYFSTIKQKYLFFKAEFSLLEVADSIRSVFGFKEFEDETRAREDAREAPLKEPHSFLCPTSCQDAARDSISLMTLILIFLHFCSSKLIFGL